MEQPLDFSKTTSTSNLIKTPPASVTVKKQLQRMKLKNLKENDFHLNSENSDESTSRSSASSPDSVENDQQQLNLQSLASGQSSSLSRDALMMLFNPQFLINNCKMNGAVPNAFGTANGLAGPQSAQFLLHQNLNNSAAFAAANVMSNMINPPNVNQQLNCQLNNQLNSQISSQINNQITSQISNQLNQIGQMSDQLNQINQQKNQSKPSKSKSNGSNFKAVPRKSMIMAKQEQSKSSAVSAKFGVLSNSQNSNILQDADKESSGSGSPLLNTSLQMSINSNLSGEENNSLYDELCSLEDGESPNSSRRRRGQPIPDAMKDDSYWVSGHC